MLYWDSAVASHLIFTKQYKTLDPSSGFIRSFQLLATNTKLHSFDQFTLIFFPVNKTNRTPSLKLKHQLLKFHVVVVVVVVDDFLFISRLHRFMLLSPVKGSCPQAHIHDRFLLYHHTLRYFSLLRRCFDGIYFILFWSFHLRNSYYKVSLQSHKVYRLSLKCYYKLFSFSSENSSPSIQKALNRTSKSKGEWTDTHTHERITRRKEKSLCFSVVLVNLNPIFDIGKQMVCVYTYACVLVCNAWNMGMCHLFFSCRFHP